MELQIHAFKTSPPDEG